MSDNGPQYDSDTFRQFATEYGFVHSPSSPHFPQSNGEAERAVQTVKGLLRKASDPYLAMLAYRATPLAVGYTSSELMMGRKLRTTVPITRELRRSMVPDHSAVTGRDRRGKERQAKNFNSHHGARSLPTLRPEDTVYVKDQNSMGTVLREVAPHSYQVDIPEGTVRRNQRHMVQLEHNETHQDVEVPGNLPDQFEDVTGEHTHRQSEPKQYSTWLRSGQAINPPDRFDNSWNKPGERGCSISYCVYNCMYVRLP